MLKRSWFGGEPKRIGVSGHRHRDGADWDWTREALIDFFLSAPHAVGLSSLAAGADQIFAEVALAYGAGHIAVVPGAGGYAETFDGDELRKYEILRQRSKRIIRIGDEPTSANFRKAGERVVREADLMIFVWDGGPAQGEGGTADIVAYAKERRRSAIWLNPITREETRL